MAIAINLTDGTTTLDLDDGSNYKIMDWSPAISSAPGMIVVEEMRVRVLGTSNSDTLANLTALVEMVNQSARWNNGEDAAAVTLNYAPDGTSLGTPAAAIVYGAGERGSMLKVPPTYNRNIDQNNLFVSLPLVRGDWLSPTATASTSGTTTQPGIMYKAIAIGDINSPYDLEFTISTSSGIPPTYYVFTTFGSSNYIIYSTESDRIAQIQAEDLAGATGWTSVDESANYASSTNVLRYIATTTAWSTSTKKLFSAITFDTSIRRMSIYAVARCSGQNHLVRIGVAPSSLIGSGGRTKTRPVLIDTTNYATPMPVYLGTVAIPPNGVFHDIVVEAKAAATTGSPILDIDYIVLVESQNIGVSGAIWFDGAQLNTYGGTPLSSVKLTVAGHELSEIAPEVYETVASSIEPVSYIGNARLRTRETTSGGAGVAAILMMPKGNAWVTVDSNNVPIEAAFTATYRVCYKAVP